MSVVPCLPAHLCVSPQRPVAGPPRERVKSGALEAMLHRRGVTQPSRATRGHQPRAARRSSAAQLAARSAAQRLAAQRSGSQRHSATAPSSSRSPQRRPEHRPDRAATVKEVHRPGLLHQPHRPTRSPIGRPARPRQPPPQPPADQHQPHIQPSAAAPASTTTTSSLS